MSIESVMPSNHLILCRPLFLLPPIPPSIRVFSNESTLRMRWSKYWSYSFSIIPSKGHPGLISFRMDWLHLQMLGGIGSLLFTAICKASPDSHFAFAFLFHRDGLDPCLLYNVTNLIPEFIRHSIYSRVFSNTTVQKHQFFGTQLCL